MQHICVGLHVLLWVWVETPLPSLHHSLNTLSTGAAFSFTNTFWPLFQLCRLNLICKSEGPVTLDVDDLLQHVLEQY